MWWDHRQPDRSHRSSLTWSSGSTWWDRGSGSGFVMHDACTARKPPRGMTIAWPGWISRRHLEHFVLNRAFTLPPSLEAGKIWMPALGAGPNKFSAQTPIRAPSFRIIRMVTALTIRRVPMRSPLVRARSGLLVRWPVLHVASRVLQFLKQGPCPHSVTEPRRSDDPSRRHLRDSICMFRAWRSAHICCTGADCISRSRSHRIRLLLDRNPRTKPVYPR